MRECWLCGREEETKHFDLYVDGSEGLALCHQCEMMLVSHIVELKHLITRTMLIRAQKIQKLRKEPSQ